LDKIKVLHINSYTYGGAAKAALRLHENFLKNDAISKFLCAEDLNGNDENVLSAYNKFELISEKVKRNILYKFVGKEKAKLLNSGKNFYGFNLDKFLQLISIKPDYIFVYWNSYFLNLEQIYSLSSFYKAPVIWYLMDMTPLTGGCNYSFGCKKYFEKCGACKLINSKYTNDISRKNWEYKNKYIQKMNMSVIASTDLLYKQANDSSLFRGKEISKIQLSVDQNLFGTENKIKARNKLNLPVEKKIIFWAANYIPEERKGYKYFEEVLNLLHNYRNTLEKKNDILIMIAGNTGKDFKPDIPFEYILTGAIADDETLATYYSASDLFACTSIEDSGPMMVNESLMSGRPIVMFDNGCANDFVMDGITGYKVDIFNTLEFAKKIDIILNLNEVQTNEIENNCRRLAMELITPEVQFKKICNLLAAINGI
jgi:glycosyltransferase involved in cell wall biosynthesis